jgi:thiamine-phosphate pyrophosphorylase
MIAEIGAHPSSSRLAAAKFYGILDTGFLPADQFPAMCRAILSGGADIVQVRAKKADRDEYRRLVESILPLFEKIDIPLIINDRLDLALEYPRCGLHVGQEDASVEEARARLGPDRIIGLTTHSVAQATLALEQAPLLSYFCIGPVFATRTKPDSVPVGLELVRAVTALNAGMLPLFSVGGINRKNIRQVRRAGAQRVAAVSDVLEASDPIAAVRELRAAMPR